MFHKITQEGLKWLRMASDGGLPEAQEYLASLYFSGKHIPLDTSKGYDLLLSAAKGGDTQAQNVLAGYHLGFITMPLPAKKSLQDGIKWLTRAGENGDVEILYMHGLLLYKGKILPKDQQAGLKLMTKAADLGYGEAEEFIKEVENAKGLYFKGKTSKRKDK